MTAPIFQSLLTLPAPPAPDPTAPSLCKSDLPLVLLPVRLETRFFEQAGGGAELRVRVYHDTIHLDSHESDLLNVEQTAGMANWDAEWRAGNDSVARTASLPTAWSRLADQFGAERAAFIVRVLTPTNQSARPASVTAAGTALSPAIVFPTVPIAPATADSWRAAPKARLLPDKWTAVAMSGATTIQVTGNAIPRPLNIGPDPQAMMPPTPPISPDQLAIDPGMKWMVDFTEAEAKGMGLRLTLPAAVVTAGIDRLMVFGVSNSLTGTDGAAQLAGLLDAHHFTDGLDFLRFGTPTNNTDDRRAPQLVDNPGHARSYSNEVGVDLSTLTPPTNAQRVGTALGIDTNAIPAVLGHVAQASDQHETNMHSMNAALWQVGWGYFLSNMIGFDGTGLTPQIVDWARDYFVTHVRAGGPFPVLRAGHQPYGVLPVTSLDLWKPRVSDESRDDWMRQLLIKLRDSVWRSRLPADTLRLGRRFSATTGPNPDADLADVMRTDGVSNGYSARTVFGGQYFQHLEAYLNQNVTGIVANAQAAWSGTLPQKLGFGWRPRVARAVGADLSWPVTAPLIQAGEVSPWKKLEPNYIADILAMKTSNLLAPLAPNDPAAPKSLLEALLRHAHGREVANATAKLAAASSSLDLGALLRDAELIDLVPDAPAPEPWRRQITRPASKNDPTTPINTFLDNLTQFNTQEVSSLGDFRSSLAWLQSLDSETLQYLMQGTLDLSSHRIDAWITSFATKRLAAMRGTTPAGVYVGGYGWVENLKPALANTAVPVTTLPAGESGPLVVATNDSGFIHAPSATHAAAAAVLRNAHLGPKGQPDGNSPFAIDLSSRRVREADRLLDGVRTGQPIGALLGYRIERALHDLGLDTAIPALRSIAPLTPAQSADANTPTDALAANNVVDGLTLAQKWSASQTEITTALTTAVGAALVGKAQNELNALTDLVDGLTDALTAEAAYQIARGNTSRAAATLSSIARGEAPPPELEVARTPRSGTPLTHRVMVLQTGTTNLSLPVWPAWNTATVSLAEPWVNSWSARLLGDPGKTRCTVERLDDTTGAVVETMTFPLKELLFQPIDIVFGVEASTKMSIAQPSGSLSYIEQAVLYQARRRTPGFASDAKLRLQHARPANLAAGEITLFDMLEQARAVRRTLAGARGVRPEDLSPTDRTAQGTVDLTEFEQRVIRAENSLNTAFKGLQTLMASKTPITAESIRVAMLKLGPFCGGAAVPMNSAGEDPATIAALTSQANALLRVAGAMDTAFFARRAMPVETDVNARITQLTDRIAGVFGQGFVMMPHITLVSTAAAELTSAFAGSKVALGGDALAANSWVTRYARVRDTISRFTSTLRGADVLGTGEKLNLSVAQLPFLSGERWVGLPPLAGASVVTGKISLVLQTYTTLNFAQVMGGLLIDEWTEVVPNASETTALTFQFDPPNAMAPQNVLVAVPPVAGVDWTADTLRRVLVETLDLAKIRAVDPEVLGETGQYLPGLYLAFNINNDAMSTDFAPLTA